MKTHNVTPLQQTEPTDLAWCPIAPGPRGVPLLRNLPDYFLKGLFPLVLETARQYCGPFRLKFGPQTLTFVTEPTQVQQVLASKKGNYRKAATYDDFRTGLGDGIITLDPPEWLPRRRLLQPFFTEQEVLNYVPIITNETAQMIARWHYVAEQHQVVDVAEDLMRLALRIIIRIVVSSDAGQTVEQLERDFRVVLRYIANLSTGVGVLRKLIPTPGRAKFQRAKARLETYLLRQIQMRHSAAILPADVLTRLMGARNPAFPGGLSDDLILAELMTLAVAGSETISLVLARIVYALATHPMVAHELQAEVDEVLHGQLPTLQVVPQLRYTTQVYQEGLRHYPSVWLFPRQAQKPDIVGQAFIPAGEWVMLCPYLSHHDPAFWPEPEEFRPERFGEEQHSHHPPFAYLPYGAGPQTCLGAHLANLEAVLVLAMVSQAFSFEVAPGFVPQDRAAVTLGLATGMRMTLHPRTALVALEGGSITTQCSAHPFV